MSRNCRRKQRKPFDWLMIRKGRRGALKMIRQAVRHGWLDGPEHAERRRQLIAALGHLPIEHIKVRELLGLFHVYFEMDSYNLDLAQAALEAEKAAFYAACNSHHSPRPPTRNPRNGTRDA
jgi:hypothetical protein